MKFMSMFNKLKKKSDKLDISIVPNQFVVVDIETTGLNPDKHEIIEIGAIRIKKHEETHAGFNRIIKTSKDIPQKITEITGITTDMIKKEGEPLEQVMRDFKDFIGDLRLVIYNAPFDMGFLQKAAMKAGFKITNPVSDALVMIRRAYPNLKSYKLTEIVKHGNIDTDGAHRALEDCRLTTQVYTTAASKLNSVS